MSSFGRQASYSNRYLSVGFRIDRLAGEPNAIGFFDYLPVRQAGFFLKKMMVKIANTAQH